VGDFGGIKRMINMNSERTVNMNDLIRDVPRPGTARDLFHKVMRFECPGHTLATLGGIWRSTFDRWISEGMPPELANIPSLFAHFGLHEHLWSGPQAQVFVYPPFEYRVVRETAETVTYVNEMGITCTDFKKDAYKSMPHFEAFPVRSRDDWNEFRHRLAWTPARVGKAWANQVAGWRGREAPLIVSLGRCSSLYGSLRDMVGVEALSYLFYDDPRLVEEMMDAVLDLFLHVTTELFRDFLPDAICMWEDMAYKTSSLLGVNQVREFMVPRYQRMTAHLRQLGVPFILLDSDGNIDQLIPLWLESGIDGVVPMEAQAGMDVALYREKYPRLLMMGGVDKKALAQGPAAIDVEIDKIRRTIASGGLIPIFDHGLPHDVSWENFQYFVARLKEVCQPC
jgi:uroporphyrinogen decarboxylase